MTKSLKVISAIALLATATAMSGCGSDKEVTTTTTERTTMSSGGMGAPSSSTTTTRSKTEYDD
jgi:hypothetical protein